MKNILFILFCLLFANSAAQVKDNLQYVDSSFIASKLDSLEKLSAYNKCIPEKYKLVVLYTLSYFPELDSTKVVFKEKRIKTTLNARPAIASLFFRGKLNRTYVIRINTSDKDGKITLDEVPFNAKIGLFGHEFNHLVDYSGKNIFGIIGRLFAYSNKGTKEKFEKHIDLLTIQRGLGQQLYDWSFFVLYESDASEKYKAYKEKVYLEPQEIKSYLQNSMKTD